MQTIKKTRTFLQWLFMQEAEKTVTYYNPLKIELNSILRLKVPDYDHFDFRLMEVQEYVRNMDGEEFTFTDYVLVAFQDGKKVIVKIRANPIPDAIEEEAASFVAMLLFYDHEEEYSEDMMAVMKECEEKKTFQVDLKGEEDGLKAGEEQHILYERCEGLSFAMKADVFTASDKNKNKRFDTCEITKKSIQYWDYAREIEIEGGIRKPEFYFIEQNKNNGSFVMLRGTIIDPSTISVL